jgi:hypothetical protein
MRHAAKPYDYTLERAREVYCRDEFSRWLAQNRMSDPELPDFQITIVTIRTNRRPRQRRRKGVPLEVLFLFGYEDAPIHWLGRVVVMQNQRWWVHLLIRVRDFYVKSQFYNADLI